MEKETFSSLYNRLHHRLKASARRLLGNDDDADDALQDAFCNLWQRRDGIVSETEATGLSVTTVRNVCIDKLRRQQSHPTDAIDDNLQPPNDNYYEDDTEKFQTVKAIIDNSLNEQQRHILYMRDYSGYSFEEIAQETGLSESNIRLILSRARRAVRQCYINSTMKQ
jgi:RNA polymerase sigma-70 factor (ECF subfamily)